MYRVFVLSLTIPLCGCAVARRHPVWFGLAIGAVGGIVAHEVTKPGTCAPFYTDPKTGEREPYNGTPPCPK